MSLLFIIIIFVQKSIGGGSMHFNRNVQNIFLNKWICVVIVEMNVVTSRL